MKPTTEELDKAQFGRVLHERPKLVTSPELLKKLADCKAIWDRMTDQERKEMIRLQAESWGRQTMD